MLTDLCLNKAVLTIQLVVDCGLFRHTFLIIQGLLWSAVPACSIIQGLLWSAVPACFIIQRLLWSAVPACFITQGLLWSAVPACFITQGLLCSGMFIKLHIKPFILFAIEKGNWRITGEKGKDKRKRKMEGKKFEKKKR